MFTEPLPRAEMDDSLLSSDPGKSDPIVQQPSKLAEVKYKAYPSRFYVIIVTGMLVMQQNIAWLTFGPIPNAAKESYGLTDVELLLLPGLLCMNTCLHVLKQPKLTT